MLPTHLELLLVALTWLFGVGITPVCVEPVSSSILIEILPRLELWFAVSSWLRVSVFNLDSNVMSYPMKGLAEEQLGYWATVLSTALRVSSTVFPVTLRVWLGMIQSCRQRKSSVKICALSLSYKCDITYKY